MRKKKVASNEGVCYVCKKGINKDPVVLVPDTMRRHRTCEPGSKRWMKSDVGKKSPLRKYFENMED